MTRIIALVCAIVVLGFGAFMLVDRQGSTPADPLLVGALDAQEAEVDTSTVTEMRLGDPDAPVTLIEYASFTCPHCATFHQGAYKQLKEDYIDTGKINFVYREVYFDRYGLWASAIARCAGPDKFFGITDLIYKGQSDWARAGGPTEIVEELRKIGRLAGIENDQLESCLQDGDKLRTLVAWYQENTEEHGITSTPSFVLNGETITNMPYAEMSALIDEALGE
jgi:protein-disulfide isomerase